METFGGTNRMVKSEGRKEKTGRVGEEEGKDH